MSESLELIEARTELAEERAKNLALSSRLDAIRNIVSGDWGINVENAIAKVLELAGGEAPKACQHRYNFASPNACILCGDDPESCGERFTSGTFDGCVCYRPIGHAGPHVSKGDYKSCRELEAALPKSFLDVERQ